MGLQIELIACAKEFALSTAESPELFSNMLLDSPEPLGDLTKTKAITYYLSRTQPGSDLGIPQTDAQSVRSFADGSVVLTVKPIAISSGGRFPYQGNDATAKAALEANLYLQSEDPRVVALARKAVGQTADTGKAVQKIEAFVAEYIDSKDLSVGYASAAEVIETRQGDCSEHAVLCAALCRALGIPAQVVVGVAYVEEFGGAMNCFGGHAWTRALIKDKWVDFDAAFKGTRRGGFDAGHITLATGNGEPGDFFALLNSLGQFKIDRVKIKK
jgi:transglutaminase-like putative cysteine protease